MVDLAYIRKRRIRRIVAAVGISCTATALVIGAIALLGQRAAPLTVTLVNSGASLSLSTEKQGGDNRVYLVADQVPGYVEYTEENLKYLPNELDDEHTYSEFADNETGTLFFKYTFFVTNNGSSEADYDLTLKMSNPTRTATNRFDLDSILRVRFYENKVYEDESLNKHEYVTYAKRSATPHYEGEGEDKQQVWTEHISDEHSEYAKEFLSSKVILKSEVKNLLPKEQIRYTFVFWLEGLDPECEGVPPVDSALILGVDVSAHEAEDSSNK